MVRHQGLGLLYSYEGLVLIPGPKLDVDSSSGTPGLRSPSRPEGTDYLACIFKCLVSHDDDLVQA